MAIWQRLTGGDTRVAGLGSVRAQTGKLSYWRKRSRGGRRFSCYSCAEISACAFGAGPAIEHLQKVGGFVRAKAATLLTDPIVLLESFAIVCTFLILVRGCLDARRKRKRATSSRAADFGMLQLTKADGTCSLPSAGDVRVLVHSDSEEDDHVYDSRHMRASPPPASTDRKGKKKKGGGRK